MFDFEFKFGDFFLALNHFFYVARFNCFKKRLRQVGLIVSNGGQVGDSQEPTL